MNPQLNLLHLKFFCDAVFYNSVSEAAKINFVTQSAVSQGISKLEKILGVELLIHSRQKFQLSHEGKVVFEHARLVFRSIQNIHEEISNQNKEILAGKLRFVTTKSIGMSLIPPMYKKAKTLLPKIELSMQLGGLNYIRNSIKQQDAEFAIVVYDQNFSQFEKHLLKKGKFNLYQSANIHPDHTENGVLVNYFKGTYVNELREHLEQHSSLKIQSELSGWEVLARFTELNLGIGFFPDYIMTHNRYPNLKTYPIQLPLFEYEICAIYNKGEKLSRAARQFLELLSLDVS